MCFSCFIFNFGRGVSKWFLFPKLYSLVWTFVQYNDSNGNSFHQRHAKRMDKFSKLDIKEIYIMCIMNSMQISCIHCLQSRQGADIFFFSVLAQIFVSRKSEN